MKWLKRKLRNWVREAEEDYSVEKGISIGISSSENRPEEEPILNFRIYNAINGQILEFRRYDRIHDRSSNSVYLIPKDEDIGDYVSKCLSMELMK